MIRRPRHRLQVATAFFDLAHGTVLAGGAGTMMDAHAAEARGAGGKPAELPAYDGTALLTGLLLLAFTGRPQTLAALARVYWQELDRRMLAALNLDRLVTPTAAAAVMTDDRAWRTAYEHLRSDVDRLLAPLDPSPHPRRTKETNAARAKRTAATTPAERQARHDARTRLLAVCNALIAGGLPPRPDHHDGSLALDGTNIEANATTRGTGTRPDRRHGADPDAGWWVQQQQQNRVVWGFCLVLAYATHQLRGREVPNVVVGFSIGPANGGDTAQALEAVDAAAAAGWGPRPGRNRTQPTLVTDRGYSDKNGLAAGALERGLGVCHDYSLVPVPADTPGGKRQHDKPPPVQARSPQGPFMYGGTVLCPGALRLVEPAPDPHTGQVQPHPGGEWDARRNQVRLIHPTHTDDDDPDRRLDATDPRRLTAHRDLQEQLRAHRMPLNSRLTLRPNGQRNGRPAADSTPVPAHSLRVICPAAAGQARCPLCPASMETPPGTLPDIHTPPAPDHHGRLPDSCAASTYTTVWLDDPAVKKYQQHMHGTDDWADRYGGSRSRDEQGHSQLNSRYATALGGGFQVTGIARVAVAAAVAVTATNHNQTLPHDERTARNGGQPPWEDRRELARRRDEIIVKARDRLRGPDTH